MHFHMKGNNKKKNKKKKYKHAALCYGETGAKTFHTSVLSTAAKNSQATERKTLPAVHKKASAAHHRSTGPAVIKDSALCRDFIVGDGVAQLRGPSIFAVSTARSLLYQIYFDTGVLPKPN